MKKKNSQEKLIIHSEATFIKIFSTFSTKVSKERQAEKGTQWYFLFYPRSQNRLVTVSKHKNLTVFLGKLVRFNC